VLLSHPTSSTPRHRVPDERWGETVKAIVVPAPVPRSTSPPSSTTVAGPGALQVPHLVDQVEALPRNPSGKILKRELRAPYWTVGSGPSTDPYPPSAAGRSGLPDDGRRRREARYFLVFDVLLWTAALTFSPACLRWPTTWSALPSDSSPCRRWRDR